MEICDLMESHRRTERQQAKQRINQDFIMAEVNARYLAMAMDGKGELPKVWEYYPELYADERTQYEAQMAADEMEDYKARRLEYVREFNRRRKRQKGGEPE